MAFSVLRNFWPIFSLIFLVFALYDCGFPVLVSCEASHADILRGSSRVPFYDFSDFGKEVRSCICAKTVIQETSCIAFSFKPDVFSERVEQKFSRGV